MIYASGIRAHSARPWLGDNAIHKLGPVLDRLAGYQGRSVDIDGCSYREGLSAVRIDAGVAGNVIPDAASVTVNFRFAPDRSPAAALAHVREVFADLDVNLEQTDVAGGALPGLAPSRAAAAPGGRGRWTGGCQIRLDGCGAVCRDGRPGGELRPGRPEPGASP